MFKNIVIAVLTVAVVVTGTTVLVQTQSANEAETSVQIAARRLDDGRVEFGLRQRQGAGWSEIRFPSRRYLRTDATVDEWKISDEIAVPATRVDVRIRDGAYVGDHLDEFLVYIDGQVYETNCGDLQLEIVTDNVIFTTKDKDCDDWIGLATACGSAEADCDLQQAMIYSWEAAQRDAYGFEEIELTLDEAQTIVDAVWYDYIGSGRESPTVEATSRTTTSYHSSSDHTINLSKWGRDLDTVLHETTHAIVNAGNRGGGHDRHYAAQILDVWNRYAPVIDTAGARLAAIEFNVEIADVAPVQASRAAGVDAVWALICTEPVRSESYCDALAGGLRTPIQQPSATGIDSPVIDTGWIGRSRPGGTIGSYRWFGSRVEDDGTTRTWVASEAVIEEDPEHFARLNLKCQENELRAQVWWRLDRGFSSAVLVDFGEGEFVRQVWSRSEGTWTVNEVEQDFRVAHSDADEAFFKELVWASAAGRDFTMQIRSGQDTYTATFDLDGLFDTPVQPNLARCGR